MSALRYWPAPEVAEIADQVIAEHHPDLADYRPRILYVFRSKAKKAHGSVALASVRKVAGLTAFLAQVAESEDGDLFDPHAPFFLMEVAAKEWERLKPRQQRALVDHELCHLTVGPSEDGTVELGLRGHDLEEFRAVIERHGLWLEDREHFADAVVRAVQLSLDDGFAELLADGPAK